MREWCLLIRGWAATDADRNRYFYGLPWSKHIVIYDTLIEKSSPAEVEAVLGHELGHWSYSKAPPHCPLMPAEKNLVIRPPDQTTHHRPVAPPLHVHRLLHLHPQQIPLRVLRLRPRTGQHRAATDHDRLHPLPARPRSARHGGQVPAQRPDKEIRVSSG